MCKLSDKINGLTRDFESNFAVQSQNITSMVAWFSEQEILGHDMDITEADSYHDEHPQANFGGGQSKRAEAGAESKGCRHLRKSIASAK